MNNDWKFLHNLLMSAEVMSKNNGKSIADFVGGKNRYVLPKIGAQWRPLPCHGVVQEKLLWLYISLSKNKKHCLFLDSTSHSRTQKKKLLEAKGCTPIVLILPCGPQWDNLVDNTKYNFKHMFQCKFTHLRCLCMSQIKGAEIPRTVKILWNDRFEVFRKNFLLSTWQPTYSICHGRKHT